MFFLGSQKYKKKEERMCTWKTTQKCQLYGTCNDKSFNVIRMRECQQRQCLGFVRYGFEDR